MTITLLAVSAEKKSRSGDECGKHMVRITFRRSEQPASKSPTAYTLLGKIIKDIGTGREEGLQINVISLGRAHSCSALGGWGVFSSHK